MSQATYRYHIGQRVRLVGEAWPEEEEGEETPIQGDVVVIAEADVVGGYTATPNQWWINGEVGSRWHGEPVPSDTPITWPKTSAVAPPTPTEAGPMFGTAEVWVVVIEWDPSMDLAIYTAPTIEDAQRAARQAVIDTFNETSDDYDPDGCRAFVLDENAQLEDGRCVVDLTDEAWLEELRDTTTQPWVTIERHDVAINPVVSQ